MQLETSYYILNEETIQSLSLPNFVLHLVEGKSMQRVYRVEQGDTEVLDDAVESHELEHAERCYEGSSALS